MEDGSQQCSAGSRGVDMTDCSQGGGQGNGVEFEVARVVRGASFWCCRHEGGCGQGREEDCVLHVDYVVVFVVVFGWECRRR